MARLNVRSLKPGMEVPPGYKLKRVLGSGGAGDVWEADAPGGIPKAVKICHGELKDFTMTGREMEGLEYVRAIRHPYLLGLDRFELIDKHLVLVMERAESSLAAHLAETQARGLPGLPRDQVLRYLAEAAEVLDHLNLQHRLQHLDVKPGNLLMCAGHIKLSDFGLVHPSGTSMSGLRLTFTPAYSAPELFRGEVDGTADQYSLAVMYQELLTGRMPFDRPNLVQEFLHKLDEAPDLSPLPLGDQAIVGTALSKEPFRRFKSNLEFVAALLQSDDTALPAPSSRRGPTTAVYASAHPAPEPVPESRPGAPADASASPDPPPAPVEQAGDFFTGGRIVVTFEASIPQMMFAHKLRGFIDEVAAEIVSGDERSAILAVREKSWLGLATNKGLNLEILLTDEPASRYSHTVVRVSIWSVNPGGGTEAQSQRAQMLLKGLKTYIMGPG